MDVHQQVRNSKNVDYMLCVYWAYMAVSFNYICIVITLNDLILSLIVKLVLLLFVM